MGSFWARDELTSHQLFFWRLIALRNSSIYFGHYSKCIRFEQFFVSFSLHTSLPNYGNGHVVIKGAREGWCLYITGILSCPLVYKVKQLTDGDQVVCIGIGFSF